MDQGEEAEPSARRPRPAGKGRGKRSQADADQDWRRAGTEVQEGGASTQAAASTAASSSGDRPSWSEQGQWWSSSNWRHSWNTWSESGNSTAAAWRDDEQSHSTSWSSRGRGKGGGRKGGAHRTGQGRGGEGGVEREAREGGGDQLGSEPREAAGEPNRGSAASSRRDGTGHATGRRKGGRSAGKSAGRSRMQESNAAAAGDHDRGSADDDDEEVEAARQVEEGDGDEGQEEEEVSGPASKRSAIGPRLKRPEGQAKAQRSPGEGNASEKRAGGKAKNNKGSGKQRVVVSPDATVTERLAAQLSSNSYECMICISMIGRTGRIWSCDNCWACFHLTCISSWIQRSNANGKASAMQSFAWQCPGCRYHRVGPIPEYTCFCGKLKDPDANPHWLPHSCGEVCERDRGCGHKCPELCHPGPCPPCAARGPPGQCHCGREHRATSRCGDPTSWSCGMPCDKPLACGQHTCPRKCHDGPCPPCAATSKQRCFCGTEVQERMCGFENFACKNICGKMLDCGNHVCNRGCHPGKCGPCPRDPDIKGDRCACGRTGDCQGSGSTGLLVRRVAARRFCTDPLPLCLEVCGRPNPLCGHPCKRTCHEDDCGTCKERVQRHCRCGRQKKDVLCSEEPTLLCKQVCKTMKTCGNHRCDVVCCEGHGDKSHESHMCLLVCGKPLACGSHTCEDFCHLGRCKPCRVLQHEPLYCACGTTSIEPPVICGTKPPMCNQPCGAALPCGHRCRLTCHYGEHQLCVELVSRQCLGGHRELHNQPCHIGAIPCGQPCGKPMPCGHMCTATCHAGDCPPCTQVCGAMRVHCEHRCEASCHFGSACPDDPCRRKLKVSCQCGMRVEEKICGASSTTTKALLSSLKCVASCESKLSWPAALRQPMGKGGAAAARPPEKYAADLHHLGIGNRNYVATLEDFFARALARVSQADSGMLSGPSRVALPPCERSRRLLAVDYARVHWRLRAHCRKDVAENWWLVTLEATPTSAVPKPLLSEVIRLEGSQSFPHLSSKLDTQPQLRFVGVRDAGDEVYDAVMDSEGLLGVRPGRDAAEVVAFFDKSAAASAVYRRLTGTQVPAAEPVPLIRAAAGKGGAGLRVVLQQTPSTSRAAVSAASQAAAPARGGDDGRDQRAAAAGGQAAAKEEAAQPPATPPVPEEEVPDSWEDMAE